MSTKHTLQAEDLTVTTFETESPLMSTKPILIGNPTPNTGCFWCPPDLTID